MKTLPALVLSSLLPLSALAAPQLECEVNRSEADTLRFAQPIVENMSVVAARLPEGYGLQFEASLAPSSYLAVIQDDFRKQRLAFTGTSTAPALDGARLSLPDAALNCRKTGEAPKFDTTPDTSANYLVCMLDEAIFEKGQVVTTKRLLTSVNSAFSFRRPVEIHADGPNQAYTVGYTSFDSLRGLRVLLVDKVTKETVSYVGPARTFRTSFMLAFTQGDREKLGRFLRLGCVFTNDPKPFLAAESK